MLKILQSHRLKYTPLKMVLNVVSQFTILTDRRINLTLENLEMHLICHCIKFYYEQVSSHTIATKMECLFGHITEALRSFLAVPTFVFHQDPKVPK